MALCLANKQQVSIFAGSKLNIKAYIGTIGGCIKTDVFQFDSTANEVRGWLGNEV